MPHQKGIKSVAQNRKAWHDYFVEEKYECGLALFGTEVKSIRQGRVNLKESWAQIRGGEIWVEGMHISPYDQGNIFNRDPMRPKKLLMHKSEIRKLDGLVSRQGYTPSATPSPSAMPTATSAARSGNTTSDRKGQGGERKAPLSLPQERNLLPQKKSSHKELLTAGCTAQKKHTFHSWG